MESPLTSLRPVGTKVFGIGLQKTGLTSVLRLMQGLGIKARGADIRQKRNFCKQNDYDAVLKYYDTADFFCDWPTPLMYRAIWKKYGDKALFILTIRKDSRAWFESLKRHNAYAHPFKNKHHWVFGRYYPHGFDEEHISYYERHIQDVLRFFEQRGASKQLLVLRVDEPQAVSKLADFLGITIERERFPHENKSAQNRPGIGNWFKRHYNPIAQGLYARYAPRILKATPRQIFPIDI
jgi:hypothetical protein